MRILQNKSSLYLSIVIFFVLFLFNGCIHNIKMTEEQELPLLEEDLVNDEVQLIEIDTEVEDNQEMEKTMTPLSILAYREKDYFGSDLEIISTQLENADYKRYTVQYMANGLKISGIMNIPNGEGPFPILILNHGYIDPAVYTNGRGLKREQDFFARNGYIVIHPDYRNHAFSDLDDANNQNLRMGYVEDVIGAVLAVKDYDDERFDTTNIGMLGHSMGGGITMKVVTIKPDLIKAVVLYGPVSADERDNFDKWGRGNPERSNYILEEYGDFDENPEFWDQVSPINYFSDIKVPILIQQGENDDSTPKDWALRIYEELKAKEKIVSINIYPNENHEFGPYFNEFMINTKSFFDQYLSL